MTAPQWQNVFRKNEAFRVMTQLLDEAGVAWSVESGGSHPKLVFAIAGVQHKHVLSTGRHSPRAGRKSACDIRRILRAAGIGTDPQPQEPDMDGDRAVPAVVPDIGLTDMEGVPLARDVDLGERLGFARPEKIRELIKRHENELSLYGNVLPMPGQTTAKGGRPAAGYLLNEEQALLIAAVSDAPHAPAVRAMLIRTFVAWRRGHLVPVRAPASGDLDALLDLMQESFYGLRKAIEASAGGLTEEQIRALLRQHCEWEAKHYRHLVDQTHLSGGRVIKALRGERLPAPTGDEMLDIDAVYRACGVTAHIPARRKLSGFVRNRLDAYCQDRLIPTGAVISLGQRVRTWPRQAVLAWFSEGGREFIAAHVKAHTVDGQTIIAFPNAGEAR